MVQSCGVGSAGRVLCSRKHSGDRRPGPPQAVFWTAHIPRITAHGFHHQDRVCSGPTSGLKLERRVPSGPMAVITGVELAKKGSIQLCPGRQMKQTG